jgi:hypothetical protein
MGSENSGFKQGDYSKAWAKGDKKHALKSGSVKIEKMTDLY